MRGGGFEVFGIKNMMNRLDQSVLKVDALCKAAVSAGCALVEKEAKLSMRGAKGGKSYKVPGTKTARHEASAPGEPPAILFGRLLGSITWNIENMEKAKPYTFKNGTDVATIPATGTKHLVVIGLVGTNVSYACIAGGSPNGTRSVIHTGNRGPVHLGQLNIGDTVLTQAGEYKPIISIRRFKATKKPNLVTIEIEWRRKKDHILTVTDDHKILCNRDGINKWVKAGELKENDIIYSPKKIPHNQNTMEFIILNCFNCGKEFERIKSTVNGRRRCFCSKECLLLWRAEYHRGRKRPSKTGRLISQKTRRRLKENPDSHPSRIVAKKGFRTTCEREIESFLKCAKVKYKTQYPVGKHFVDFLIPSKRMVIEADGAFWHQDQIKDIKRDKDLKRELPGWKIVHIHFSEERFSPKIDPYPLSNVTYLQCNPSMDSFVFEDKFERKRIKKIKKWIYNNKGFVGGNNPPFLYDISVEGIHSLVVNGILVSNSHLEAGTSKIAPRPFLFPALKRKQGEIALLFRETLKKL